MLTRWSLPALLLPVVLGVFGAGLAPSEVAGQGLSARAYLNPTTVAVGRPFYLNVEVTGVQSVDSHPQLPDLAPYATYLGSSTSTSMQIVNNRTTVSLTLQYRYQALQEGTVQIPALYLMVAEQTLQTEPLTLTISAEPPPDPQRPGQDAEVPGIRPEDLFIRAEASRTRVREGEPLVVEYRVFTRVDVSTFSYTSMPEPEGFWVEELPLPGQPEIEQVVRDGVQYASAVIHRMALVPTGPGERTLGPLGIEAQVRIRRPRSRDLFESFFDLDRSSLFGSVVPTTVASNPLTITVDPLPPGRPDPFSGVVGELSLTATLDRDSVDANEAVTLRVRASGRGNLRAMPDPALDLPMDFEAYPPEISESVQRSGSGLRGSKTWEWVLIPRAPGTREVPPVAFGYYDTEADAYRTAATDPLSLVVTGEALEGPAVLTRGGVATLREDIRFIHLGTPRLARTNRSTFGGTGFWLLLLLPMAAVLGALGLRFHQDRLAGDPAYARWRRAGKVAHTRLAKARRMASGESSTEFYAEVATALRGFVADKLDVAEAGMQMRDAEARLRTRGASEDSVKEFAACVERCDRQRFAPEAGDAEEETRFLKRVSKVMTALDREIGR